VLILLRTKYIWYLRYSRGGGSGGGGGGSSSKMG